MSAGAVETVAQHPLDREVRLTLQVAMAIFVYVIGIGILNGLDLIEFSRPQLLSHLHGGTLGWMTLGIIAATMWLFVDRTAPPAEASLRRVRGFVGLAGAAITLYVAAFATTTNVARPLGGTATFLALAGIATWAYLQMPRLTLTVPRLLVLLGLTSSVLGGAFGVINGFAIALEWTWVPDSFFEAHPGTMEIGFVMPVAMGLAEWGLRIGEPDERADRAGLVQAGLMFAAFAWALGFILAGQTELVGAGIALGIIAIGIFLWRMRGRLRRISLTALGPGRHAATGGVLLAVTMIYAFSIISSSGGDFEAIPRGQALAFLHLLAIGATTNALLAFVVHLSRRVSPATLVDDLVYWGVNVGLVGFATALTLDVRGLILLFVPVMGAALLLAIAVHLGPLRRAPEPDEVLTIPEEPVVEPTRRRRRTTSGRGR